jgi:hypothetical protein
MKSGYLSQYFTGVAIKHLSAVEADVLRSHQHEFNGVAELMELFGQAYGRQKYPATFLYLGDGDNLPDPANGFVTWYDAREAHPTRSEHRLYFPTTPVSEHAAVGDLLVLARRPDGSVLVLVAEKDSTIANQIQWLFGLTHLTKPGFAVRDELDAAHDRLAFASRRILESIGVEADTADDSHLEEMLRRFGGTFPPTRDFSGYARSTVRAIRAKEGPDEAIMAWMDGEETLFRTLERHIIADRLKSGFDGDVDKFIAFSLSVQNRRKSRVGLALEHHLEIVFAECGIRYARAAATEKRSKPDFLFPGAGEYHTPDFPAASLTMLGVKSTCKDRWRQVLVEASRIKEKHLLTLESGISTNQTDEMASHALRLVVPQSLHETYKPIQRRWLMSVSRFTGLVLERQT